MRNTAARTFTSGGFGNSRTGLLAERRTGAASWIAAGLRRAARWSSRRWTADALLALDDHLLDDIGLSRAEAERLVRTGRLFDERC